MLVLSSLLKLIDVLLHLLYLHLNLRDPLLSLLLHLVQVLLLLLNHMDLEQVVILQIVDVCQQGFFVEVDGKVIVFVIVFQPKFIDLNFLFLRLLLSH